VPIYQGGLLAQALRIANEEHKKTYSCIRYNEHKHATTNNRYALLARHAGHRVKVKLGGHRYTGSNGVSLLNGCHSYMQILLGNLGT